MTDWISRSVSREKSRTPSRHFGSPNCQRFQDGLREGAGEGKTTDSMLESALQQRPSILPAQLRNLERGDAIYRWDQPGEGGRAVRGWRLLSSQGRNREALDQINQVLMAHSQDQWPSRLGRHIVAFHGLQLAVQEGLPRKKIEALAKEAKKRTSVKKLTPKLTTARGRGGDLNR